MCNISSIMMQSFFSRKIKFIVHVFNLCVVDLLVSLLTIEAQSYGPNSLVGIKVVEYCPPPHLMQGVSVDHGQTPVLPAPPGGHPVSQPLPPSHSKWLYSKAYFVKNEIDIYES